MKKVYLLNFLVMSLLISCSKQVDITTTSNLLETPIKVAQSFLKKKIPESQVNKLDWKNARIFLRNNKPEIIAIPNLDKTDKKVAYVFLDSNSIKGNWVSIEKFIGRSQNIVSTSYDNVIRQVSNIDTSGYLSSIERYENGILVNRYNNQANRTLTLEVPATIEGPNWELLLLCQLLGIGQTSSNFSSAYSYINADFSSVSTGGGGFGWGSAGSGASYQIYENVLYSYQNSRGAINLQKYFNCFNAIPDAGATYSVTLCADLAFDNDPEIVVDDLTPGHVFITLEKMNGSQTITQTVGFYPQSAFLSVFGAPVNSRMVDDGKAGAEHEYNASLALKNLTKLDFNSILNLALANASTMKYDVNNYNCTDFALDCINSVRSDPLIVPDWLDPIINYGKTPNGLYKKLKEMKDANTSEAANIQIGVQNAATSHGPCN